jgi:two-component sensor histidine kinase
MPTADRFSDLDHLPIGLAVLDRELRVVFWNGILEQWTGLPRERTLGRAMADLNPIWSQAHYADRLDHLFGGGPPVLFSPLLHPRIIPQAPGATAVFQVKATAVPDGRGRWWALLSVEDVTVLARRIDELKVLRAQQDRMMREIHHRVKNNLNMISGLVTLQKARVRPGADEAPFEDLQSRIAAISEIHDLLYRSSDMAIGNPAEYLGALAQLLDRNLSVSDTHNLVLELEASIVLKTDSTILLGMVQAELITNALKYGLGRRRDESLTIRLFQEASGQVVYELSHTGNHLPEDFNPTTSAGLGMVLLTAYATQLGTELGWSRGDPTRFWLRFQP